MSVSLAACGQGDGSSAHPGAGGGAGAGTGGGSGGSGASNAGGTGGKPPPPIGSTLATLDVIDQSGSSAARSDVPVTFGQPFVPGDVPAGATVAARLDGANVPLQVDVKATHADGSLRHAVLTALVPKVPAGGSAKLELVSSTTPLAGDVVPASAVLGTSFDATVSATLGGGSYTASARSLLQSDSSHVWLNGPLVTEWALSAPLKNGASVHPQLSARFDVRAYAGAKTIVVSAAVENDWAFEAGPQNFVYDASVSTDAGQVFQKDGLTHYRQARWRKRFVWGDEPKVDARHDVAYLLATGSIPNFDLGVKPAESALAALGSVSVEPMGVGLADAHMPDTGGRADIGPAPAWVALWVLSQDPRAKSGALATADGAGSWPIHYRDKNTDRPVSLADFPYMTLLGNPGDAVNPKTGKSEAFPACASDCSCPYDPDSAHQPSLVYIPYLLTGDHYYLEELMFWADWNMFQSNPGYRGQEKGLVNWDQARGQGWSMRTLGQVAYVTPDADPMKNYFVDRLEFNLDWYNAQYPNNPSANSFGYLLNGYTLDDDGTIGPWMDDFFTWSMGYLVDLGFDQAKAMRDYKVKFQISRMTDASYCWILASTYHMNVKDVAADSFYGSWAAIYAATLKANGNDNVQSLACGSTEMAAALGLKPGEMVGYSNGPEGYPSNLQPALAVAKESGVSKGDAAWTQFSARAVKPDYSAEPQFAIVPR